MRRQVLGLLLLAALGAVILVQIVLYLTNSTNKRPVDFLQVWAAGRLTLDGENPYDARKMYDLQQANRTSLPFASMMWVPPWGLSLALPIGAMPVGIAQAVWVFGQVGLIVLSAVILWRLNGGAPHKWWAPLGVVLAFGTVWWQSAVGQYAGVMLLGVTGYLAAQRANRPFLAGLSLTLIAIKPHLFVLLAVGFVIDAVRTPFGRRVVLGGATGLAIAAAVATCASPAVWREYVEAATSPGSTYGPSIRFWQNPTIPAYIRSLIPGKPFWVQTVPAVIASFAFALYWWRSGGPQRWPEAVNWVIPVGLLLAPYGSWPSDLVLLLVPTIAVAVKADARGWAIPNRWIIATLWLLANAGVMVMFFVYKSTEAYVWVAPALCGCLLWVKRGLDSQPQHPANERSEMSKIQNTLPVTA